MDAILNQTGIEHYVSYQTDYNLRFFTCQFLSCAIAGTAMIPIRQKVTVQKITNDLHPAETIDK